MLQGIAASAAIAIDNARLYQVAVEKGRMERELQVAREVQTSLLPRDVPELTGWDFASWWQPAREVSGDFYDFVSFRDGSLGLIIGDVTDKGMPAALFMASARSVVRASVAATYEPALALEQANDVLAAEAPNGMFVTLLLAQVAPGHGGVRIVNAGNQCPILYRHSQGTLTDLGSPNLPLGIEPGVHYHAAEELLVPGDFLLLYTDGLTDATDQTHSLFGSDRVRSILQDHHSASADDLRERLRLAVAAFIGSFPPYDDVTYLLARRTA
jgi:sigma-B regulation protein RsbU (phosphoserine phosphatase)